MYLVEYVPEPAAGAARTNPGPDFVASVNPQNDTLPEFYSPRIPAAMRGKTKPVAARNGLIAALFGLLVYKPTKKQPVSGENFKRSMAPAITRVNHAKSSPDGLRKRPVPEPVALVGEPGRVYAGGTPGFYGRPIMPVPEPVALVGEPGRVYAGGTPGFYGRQR